MAVVHVDHLGDDGAQEVRIDLDAIPDVSGRQCLHVLPEGLPLAFARPDVVPLVARNDVLLRVLKRLDDVGDLGFHRSSLSNSGS